MKDGKKNRGVQVAQATQMTVEPVIKMKQVSAEEFNQRQQEDFYAKTGVVLGHMNNNLGYIMNDDAVRYVQQNIGPAGGISTFLKGFINHNFWAAIFLEIERKMTLEEVSLLVGVDGPMQVCKVTHRINRMRNTEASEDTARFQPAFYLNPAVKSWPTSEMFRSFFNALKNKGLATALYQHLDGIAVGGCYFQNVKDKNIWIPFSGSRYKILSRINAQTKEKEYLSVFESEKHSHLNRVCVVSSTNPNPPLAKLYPHPSSVNSKDAYRSRLHKVIEANRIQAKRLADDEVYDEIANLLSIDEE